MYSPCPLELLCFNSANLLMLLSMHNSFGSTRAQDKSPIKKIPPVIFSCLGKGSFIIDYLMTLLGPFTGMPHEPIGRTHKRNVYPRRFVPMVSRCGAARRTLALCLSIDVLSSPYFTHSLGTRHLQFSLFATCLLRWLLSLTIPR